MTKEQAQELVAILVAAWPRPAVEKATVHAYAFGLADLEYSLAQAAVRELIQTARFLPTVAEIRDMAARQAVFLPTPEEAWGIVREAINRYGGQRVPHFDCDEIQEAVNAMGWVSMGLEENPASVRARFIDAFKGFAQRRLRLQATGRWAPPDRHLPENTTPHSGKGDPNVRVVTGYGTDRPRFRELQAHDERRRIEAQRQLEAPRDLERVAPDEEGQAAVLDLDAFRLGFPSKRGA